MESLKKINFENHRVILVDNNSTDNSFNKLKQYFRHENIVFLKNKYNYGYSGGNNAGIKFALKEGADYVFILNNDTIIGSSDILSSFVDIMEKNKKIGILGPKLKELNSDKTISNYDQSFFWKLIDFFLKNKILNIKGLNNVSRVSGAAILINKDVFLNIGLLNEDFFMYAEENDFCIRAKKNGFQIYYYDKEIVYRKSSENSDVYMEFRNYYDYRNTLYLINRNFNPLKKIILYFVFILISCKNFLKYIFKGKYKISFSIFKGVYHYFLGVKGKMNK